MHGLPSGMRGQDHTQWRRVTVQAAIMIYLKVVAGLLYNLVLEVGESEYCEKDGDSSLETVPSLEECPVNVDTVCVKFSAITMV